MHVLGCVVLCCCGFSAFVTVQWPRVVVVARVLMSCIVILPMIAGLCGVALIRLCVFVSCVVLCCTVCCVTMTVPGDLCCVWFGSARCLYSCVV